MELVQQSKPFSREDWFYEIKYDGFRGLAYVEQGACQLVSRNEFDYSRFKDLMLSNTPERSVNNVNVAAPANLLAAR